MKKAIVLMIAIALLLPFGAFAAEDGAALYKAKCQMCHGPDGKKSPKADLTSAEVQGKDIAKFLAEDAKHKGKLANEEQIKAVAAFVKSLK